MGLRELFVEILERYPQEYAQDNKVSSPYYKDLKQRIEQTFQPLLEEFGFGINALGGQGVMRKTPYITFLAEGHRTNKGIYPAYHFDLDQQLVYLHIGDADDNEPPRELAQQFAALAVDLLPQFQTRDEDGYPRQIYAKPELQEDKLIEDLKMVFKAYQRCANKLNDQLQLYLHTEEKFVIGPAQLEKLWERFHSRISGFADFISPGAAFSDQELKYKRHALQRYRQKFGNNKVQELLQEGKGQVALKEISNRVTANFVQYNSWRQSIGATDRQATAILQAFLEVAQQEYQGAQALLPIFEQTKEQGLSPAWDTLSVLLWAMRPTDYAPIKISYYRKLAEELGQPLPSGKPTPEKFETVLKWMQAFREALQPYHPANWIDVQSFIWCVCPWKTSGETKYWTIAPGENAKLWDDFKHESMIAIGGVWDTLGDLTQYADKETIRKALQRLKQTEDSKKNDALACYEFSRVMQIGDYLLAKKGRDLIIGYGQVTSDYLYDDTRLMYKHVRQVRWLAEGEWHIPEGITTFSAKTLTNVTPYQEWLKTILALIKTPLAEPISPPSIDIPNMPSFSKEQALENLFLEDQEFDAMLALLKYKKNIILQGPPGVGKSFIAKQVAYTLIGCKDDENVEMIQFHQAYSYEDFMQGFRPTADGKFALQNGVFYEFCKKAQRDEAHKYVFIIDEINRGNLSKIFGELLLLIEPDKRGQDFAMKLTYSPAETFYLPENLYVIGLMNTADRSLAMVDYALRRRFGFLDLKPQFTSPKYKAFLLQKGVPETLIEKIIERLTEVNTQIADDPNLGWGYCIGHSFFCPHNEEQNYDDAWYQQVIAYEVAPLLREYWFDKSQKADKLIEKLHTK